MSPSEASRQVSSTTTILEAGKVILHKVQFYLQGQ